MGITSNQMYRMSLKEKIRFCLWRMLGIDYTHIMRVVDDVYLKEDVYTTIGSHSYNNHAKIYRWSDAPLIIGKYCAISYGVKFVMDDGKHKVDTVTSYPFKHHKIGGDKGIRIGDDVWIGMNCLVGGVPAKIIKRKCTEEEAAQMNKIAWWDWDDDKVERCYEDFKLPIPEFIKKHQIR